MLWDEIYKSAVLDAEMKIPVTYAYKWFNEGKHKLSMEYDTALKPMDIIYTIEESDLLPDGCLRISKVVDQHYNKYPFYYVDMTTKKITFQHSGVYTVTCLFETDDYRGEKPSPELRSEYCPCVAKYVASRHLKKINAQESRNLLSDFMSDASVIHTRLKRGAKTNNPRPVARFR